ncbi:MAG TPA: zinc-binding dehydrogenase [Candidatus Acidoferrales bacterium]|nr:zinc-binding dehydrogenase [Candidatus Acidoferrales bacterium]
MQVLSQGRSAVLEEPAGPAGVRLRDRPRTQPPDGYASVEMRAAALNHLDLWIASGRQKAELPRVIGGDGAGVEQGTGQEVVVYPVACCWRCERCRAGQQVFCPEFGVIGEHTDGTACELLQVPAQNLFPKPAGLSWEEAAAFPLTFLTAWRMLVTRARLQPWETLLVVGAGAGVAAAAIAIGRHLGARVLATSRSPEKRRQAERLGAELTFESSGFGPAVREATGGRGADVVFEHVGPATLDDSTRALAPGGRLVFCGSTSGVRAELNLPRLFFRQAEMHGSTMGNAGEFAAVLRAVGQGLRPVVDQVFPLEEAPQALEHLEREAQFGKVVLRVSD